ncbi:TPA: hypothetical protein SL218_004567 [Pseudomonas aeruginosa]|nr:hypothetical protein [Pseudomonas aeruginosa]HEJ2774323.1 hypothetical protein [Pseudomonas aeruginosa]
MKNDMHIFLGGVLTGSPHSRKRHLMQATVIQDAIEKRWGPDHPARWKNKHLRWFLQEQAKSAYPETSYRYWLTARLLVERLHKANDWLPHLNGPWTQKPKAKIRSA